MLSEIPRSDSLIRTNAKLNAPRQKTYVPIIAKSVTNLFSCQHSLDVTGYGLFDLHRREFLFYKEYQDIMTAIAAGIKLEYPYKPLRVERAQRPPASLLWRQPDPSSEVQSERAADLALVH
jgi:hypothetical protein